jgi:asparagine synthase (glutamine-hydrolysing)
MCGIAGIISNNSSLITADRIKKMTDTLVHRGPDAEGHWVNTTTALGNRRLAIIDLSNAANQPLHYLQRYTIIHNGEIYNYIELKKRCKKKVTRLIQDRILK